MCSASSIARLIEATVASMLTTTPLRSPFEGCVPMPMMSMPSSVTSPTMAQILVVPMSRPTRMSPLFAMFTSGRVARRAPPTGALSGALHHHRLPGGPAPRRARPATTRSRHRRGRLDRRPVPSRHREPHGDPVRPPPVLEVEHLGAPPLGLHRREDALQARELLREGAVAEPDLQPVG